MILELATFANSLAHIIAKSERTQGKMVKNGHFSFDRRNTANSYELCCSLVCQLIG